MNHPLQPRCVKTGCGLITPHGDFFWGDLHQFGELYIFNAATNAEGKALAGTFREQESASTAVITAPPSVWERRGVFIFPVVDAELNDSLARYLGA